MQLTESDTENDSIDCCNSGCNNCVLDIRQKNLEKSTNRNRLASHRNRINVFGGSYATFQVKSIERCTTNVLRYRFQFVHRNNQTEKESELQAFYLNIPSTYFVLLRAPNPIKDIAAEAPTSATAIATTTTTATKTTTGTTAATTTTSTIETTCVAQTQLQLLLGKRERHDKTTEDIYISRPYTPLCFDSDALTFDIAVKHVPNGLMSQYLSELCVNDLTEWKGVFGSFQWSPNKYKYLICLCQGVAIAPIHSLIRQILHDDTDDTIIHLIACFQDIDSILLRDEYCTFRQYWNFQSTIYLSAQLNDCARCSVDAQRKVNCQCIKQYLKFNENICNYRLDGRELINFYRQLNTNSICTVFCGVKKLEKVIRDCLNVIDDNTINANYYVLE